MTGPQQLTEQSVNNRSDIVMLHRTINEAHLTLQCGVTNTARHAALSHSFDYISTT